MVQQSPRLGLKDVRSSRSRTSNNIENTILAGRQLASLGWASCYSIILCLGPQIWIPNSNTDAGGQGTTLWEPPAIVTCLAFLCWLIWRVCVSIQFCHLQNLSLIITSHLWTSDFLSVKMGTTATVCSSEWSTSNRETNKAKESQKLLRLFKHKRKQTFRACLP